MNVHTLVTDPNVAYLDAKLRGLRRRLEPPIVEASADASSEEDRLLERAIADLEKEPDAPNALRLLRLARLFSLDSFEVDVLLLAAAPELDERLGAVIANAQPNSSPWPTVGLAIRLYCKRLSEAVAARDTFRADGPLLRFQLLEPLDETVPLPLNTLRIDRRIADEMAGRTLVDARLVPYLRAGASEPPLARRELTIKLAGAIGSFLRESDRPSHLVIVLSSASDAEQESLARGAASLANLPLLTAQANDFPHELAGTLVRESILLPAAVFVSGFDLNPTQTNIWLRALVDCGPILFLGCRQPELPMRGFENARWLTLPMPPVATAEREQAWRQRLATVGIEDEAAARALDSRFPLDESQMQAVIRDAAATGWFRGELPTQDDVRAACELASNHRMGNLAQKLIPSFTWEDLLLPEDCLAKLHELEAHVSNAERVFDELGFAMQIPRSRGVSALFSGPSGTGKTIAAEVMAGSLRRELYRVDLARIVSKYIGETEKNLRDIFAEAESARCVVLFDEADAMFGKRTEIRDSHDRYANIEVSYLLQLMEDTRHAVILLASNRRDAIDDAFIRRFRFIIDFAMPSPQVRLAMWKRSFPREVDTRGLRFDVLAERLSISGANIKNIALAATFLASADNSNAVRPAHIERATRRELEKLMRPTPLREADLAARVQR